MYRTISRAPRHSTSMVCPSRMRRTVAQSASWARMTPTQERSANATAVGRKPCITVVRTRRALPERRREWSMVRKFFVWTGYFCLGIFLLPLGATLFILLSPLVLGLFLLFVVLPNAYAIQFLGWAGGRPHQPPADPRENP